MTDELALTRTVTAQLQRAADVAPLLARLSTGQKDTALLAMAEALMRHRYAILEANGLDVQTASQSGETGARLERLTLTESRIRDMVTGLEQIAQLPDPVGEALETFERPNGLRLEKVRVPIGVIAVVYESRPNVTVDSAALALKTGNVAVLRGGKEALGSNRALVEALQEGLAAAAVPTDAIQFIAQTDRRAVDVVLTSDHLVDLAIPRGGAGLIQRVKEMSRVPVIETGVGNCHVYVHAGADLDMAASIVINAKTQRPSVCNAMETLLLDGTVLMERPDWFVALAQSLRERGVELRLDEPSLAVLQAAGLSVGAGVMAAAEEDYATEFSALILAVKTVSGVEEALEHIRRYGTKHSECIVTADADVAERFLRSVDAAAVYHNASTRFTDGFEFGYGAEIGISTQKLHARGPMGLRELCSYKYLVRGTGQVRG